MTTHKVIFKDQQITIQIGFYGLKEVDGIISMTTHNRRINPLDPIDIDLSNARLYINDKESFIINGKDEFGYTFNECTILT